MLVSSTEILNKSGYISSDRSIFCDNNSDNTIDDIAEADVIINDSSNEEKNLQNVSVG